MSINMISKKVNLLTIGFNYKEINLIQDELSKEFSHFSFDFAISVQDSIYRLNLSEYDIVIIDLTASDADNLIALKEIYRRDADITSIVTVNSSEIFKVANKLGVKPRYFVFKDENFAVKLAGYIKNIVSSESTISETNFGMMAKTRSFFQSLIDTVHDQIMIVGLDYHIKYVNQTLLEKFHCSPNDVIGKNCFEFVYRFETPCSEKNMPCPLKAIAVNRQTCQMVHTYHGLKNNQIRNFHISALPFMNEFNTNVEILIAVKEEATPQAAPYDNKLLYMLVNGLSEGLVFCDSENNIVLINQAAEELLHIDRKQILGNSMLKLPLEKGLHWLGNVLQAAKSNLDVTIPEKIQLNESWLTLQFVPLYQENQVYIGGILYTTEKSYKEKPAGIETDLISLSKLFSAKVMAEG